MNKVILIGKIVTDIDNMSDRMSNFLLTTCEKLRDELHYETHRIMCFEKLRDFSVNFLCRDKRIIVEGVIRNRDGKSSVYARDIKFLD